MKKLLLALAVALAAFGGAKAGNYYAHDASVLPKTAQTTLASNFKSPVSVVKIDKDFGRVCEYDVALTDGSEVSFDAAGNWENIEVARSAEVPESILPEGVREYVALHHPGARVIGIEKDRRGYEVELSNGIDMEFNRDGVFRHYD